MRIVLAKRVYRREADRVRNLTGEFWVMFIDGVVAYRAAKRAELVALLTED